MKVTPLGPQFIFAQALDSAAEAAIDAPSPSRNGDHEVEALVNASETQDDSQQETKDGLNRLLEFVKKRKKRSLQGGPLDVRRERAVAAYTRLAAGAHADSTRGLKLNRIY